MVMLVCSPRAIAPIGVPSQPLVHALITIAAQGHPVGVISNHPKPSWFDGCFNGSSVQFLQEIGRQNGDVISLNAAKFGLKPHDALVLAGSKDDVHMGKNGHAVLLAAGWATDAEVQALGIKIADADELLSVFGLTENWSGQWWYSADKPLYSVRALADLSQYGKTFTQQQFADKVKQTAKHGGPRLNALLAVTARSLLTDGWGSKKDSLWGVYPSSSSDNDDTEILSDFTHRLRTTVSRVRFCKRGEPLFIRHTASPKRHTGGGGDRTDPTSQIQTLYLNPAYKGKINGRHVVVVDDCLSYGLSFSVASAFLRKAGAASVTGIALGKFGEQLRYYEITILSDPFQPVIKGGWKMKPNEWWVGKKSQVSQNLLTTLIP